MTTWKNALSLKGDFDDHSFPLFHNPREHTFQQFLSKVNDLSKHEPNTKREERQPSPTLCTRPSEKDYTNPQAQGRQQVVLVYDDDGTILVD